jgi:hypothetical protein
MLKKFVKIGQAAYFCIISRKEVSKADLLP